MIIPNSHCMIPVAKSPQEYQAYRISPDSSNKLAIAYFNLHSPGRKYSQKPGFCVNFSLKI